MSAELYPDEYLFDGGDRALPVHYNDFNRLGLDTEDAVVEFTDHRGERHMKPTNRVAVYAPRFGSVRSMSAVEVGSSGGRLAQATDAVWADGVRNREVLLQQWKNDAADRIRVRSRASGVETRLAQAALEQATVIVEHLQAVRLHSASSFVQTGELSGAERPRLTKRVQAALAWSQRNSPVVVAKTDALHELRAWAKPLELVGLEEKGRRPGNLRIVKLADKPAAEPQDVVTFTIRYDNIGDKELYDVRIVDNLTPRLEYVPDSATSDRAGRLVVEDNVEGSLVLKFEISEPIPGGEGGVVTFRARIR